MRTQPMRRIFQFIILMLILISTACGTPTEEQETAISTPTEGAASLTTSTPTATATPTPLESLTVCTAALPESLFPFNEAYIVSKRNALAMIYQTPFVESGGQINPTILERVPTQANADLSLIPVEVQRGQPVVDALGNITVLKPGVVVRPTGCRGGDCVITWDGTTPLTMEQMAVNYRLREDLTWSDGIPVIAEDSVLRFNLMAASGEYGAGWAFERTDAYTVIDQKTVEWLGLPGFTTSDLALFFWLPLPSHLYAEVDSLEQLAVDETLGMSPIGYGPFVLSGWEEGAMRFVRNPYYFQAQEGLPKLDQVEFQLVEGGTQAAWEALQNGECDLLDNSYNWIESPAVLDAVQSDSNFELVIEQSSVWTQLVFGIQPSSYDVFYNPQVGDRPDLLGDSRTRQAIFQCLDRDSMLTATLGDLGQVWPSFLSPTRSQLAQDAQLAYNPAVGAELLAGVGWVDHDGDPSTPLQAWNVAGVPVGTSLSLELLVSPYGFHQDLGLAIQNDLAQCGIGITVNTLPPDALYAPGPEGPLFGRQFDLALISWGEMPGGDCQLYQSWQMPSEENYWIGTNIAGLLNEGYDSACSGGTLALPVEKDAAVRQAEKMFLSSLPAVPLFSIPRVMVLPASGCFEGEFSTESGFFPNIAHFGMDEMCP